MPIRSSKDSTWEKVRDKSKDVSLKPSGARGGGPLGPRSVNPSGRLEPTPPDKPTVVQGYCCFSARQRHGRIATNLPWKKAAEVPVGHSERTGSLCTGLEGVGGKKGRWLLFLRGACYFGPTKSLFLMDLRSDESDKTSHSDLFT